MDDALGQALGLAQRAHVVEQHDELVAAEARQRIALAHAGRQALRDDAQQVVTGFVASRVIHLLEAIQIQEQHSDLARLVGLTGRLLHHGLHALREISAVVQAGERITLREERELLLVQPAIAELVAHAETAERKAYDDAARHQLLLIIKGGNPCGFPEINLD